MPTRKQVGAIVFVVIVVAICAFAAGRFSRPAKVEFQEKIVYKDKIDVKTDTQEKDKTRDVKTDDTNTDLVEHKLVVRHAKKITKPDGATEETTDETEESGAVLLIDSRINQSNQTKVEVNQHVETHETITLKDNVKRVETSLPDWRVSALVGLGGLTVVPPGLSAPLVIYGAEVERRILGPFWFGLWGTGSTNGRIQAGGKLSVEF